MPLSNPQPSDGQTTWKKECMSRANTVDQTLNIMIANDFETNSMADTRVTGTGAVTYDTGLTGGVARLKTGVAAIGADALVYNAGGVPLIGNPKDESWYVESRCWIKNAPNNLTGYDCIAIQDTFAAGHQYVSFGLYGSVDTTYLLLTLNLGGPVTNYVSNVAADLTGFHFFGIGRDAVNDKLYAMLDGSPIMEKDGPFGNLTSNPCFSYSNASTGILGQNVEQWVDCIAAVVKRTG